NFGQIAEFISAQQMMPPEVGASWKTADSGAIVFLRMIAMAQATCVIVAVIIWSNESYDKDLARLQTISGVNWVVEGGVLCAVLLVVCEIANSLAAIKALAVQRELRDAAAGARIASSSQ